MLHMACSVVHLLARNSSMPFVFAAQVIIIWSITLLATTSVVLGLHMGIRRFSEVTWLLGMFIITALFFLGSSWYVRVVLVSK